MTCNYLSKQLNVKLCCKSSKYEECQRTQVGAAEIIVRVVDDLKDENEQYRKMVMETIEQILTNMGATDIDNRLEEQLIDGILYAFQVSKSLVPSLLVRLYLKLTVVCGKTYMPPYW